MRLAHEAISHALGGGFTSFRSGANNTGSLITTSTITEAKPTSTLINPSSNPNQTLKSLPAVIPKPTKPAPKKQPTPCPPPQPQSQPTLKGSVGTTPRPISTPNPNSIQAAAFAAGGRIANPSTARSLLEAAKSKNVVHIRSGGVSLSNKPMVAAHTTINISAVRAPSSTVQTPNPNSNSSPGNGGIQVSAHLKKVKGIGANGDEVEADVMDVDGNKDAIKLNSDDKGATVNKENSKVEERNEAAGRLIGVEKPVGGVVSSNLKAVGVSEMNGKDNQTVVLTESKVSEKDNQTVVKTENKEKAGL